MLFASSGGSSAAGSAGTGHPKHWQQDPDTLIVLFTVALPTEALSVG